jgi:hypothetical protein
MDLCAAIREHMEVERLVATRTLLAIGQKGDEFVITLGVGKPYEISEDEWACPVILQGLHDQLRDLASAACFSRQRKRNAWDGCSD